MAARTAAPAAPIAADTLDPEARRRMMIKAVVASAVGTTIEWYDFFLYGVAAALVFPRLFFPGLRPVHRHAARLLHLLRGLRGAAVRRGLLRPLRRPARPQGGAHRHAAADGRARRRPSAWCRATTASASGAPCCSWPVPDRCRASASAASGAAAVLMAGEWTDPKRRGFTTSWAQFGAPAGMVLANGALSVMTFAPPEEAFLDWGWRVPFLLSVSAGARGPVHPASASSRRRCSPSSRPRGGSRTDPGRRSAAQDHWREVILTALLRSGPADALLHLHDLRPHLRHRRRWG